VGEWKAQVSFRICHALRAELQEFASRERRTLGNLGALILEWGFDQLKTVGSTHRLLKYKISPPARPRTCASQVGNPLGCEQNAESQRRQSKNA
jgi:hypothetical protein